MSTQQQSNGNQLTQKVVWWICAALLAATNFLAFDMRDDVKANTVRMESIQKDIDRIESRVTAIEQHLREGANK